jgi:hypothetical protein
MLKYSMKKTRRLIKEQYHIMQAGTMFSGFFDAVFGMVKRFFVPGCGMYCMGIYYFGGLIKK